MGWVAGEEMDLCYSVTEEGMSTFEAGGREVNENENEKSSSKTEDGERMNSGGEHRKL